MKSITHHTAWNRTVEVLVNAIVDLAGGNSSAGCLAVHSPEGSMGASLSPNDCRVIAGMLWLMAATADEEIEAQKAKAEAKTQAKAKSKPKPKSKLKQSKGGGR